MKSIAQDFRHAFRSLRRSPAFAAVAIATLALGIGANTAMYSVVDGVLLRPLHFPHPERLMTLWDRDADGSEDNVGWPTYVDWRRFSRSWTDIAVMSSWTPTLTGRDQAEGLEGLRVTDGYFRVLGLAPALGRDFLPDEDRLGRNHVVILGHDLFERRFGGDRSLLGKSISLGGIPYTVVGVLPPNFDSVFASDRRNPTQIWSPLGYDSSLPYACRDCRHLRAIGRLKPSVPLSEARTELDGIARQLARAYPDKYGSPGAVVIPLDKRLFGNFRLPLFTLLGAVGFVLLIACANVASLVLARSEERRKEIAIRRSLGAGRARLARLLLAESLVLSLAGGALGLAIAAVATRALVASIPLSLPRLETVGIDLRVLLACLIISLATGIAFGIAPAIRMSRTDPAAAMAEASHSSPGRRSRRTVSALVITDVALAVVLLSGAGLLISSLTRLLDVAPGFEPRSLASIDVHLSGARFKQDGAVLEFYRQALERVRAVPGVESAATTSQLPLGNSFDGTGVHIEEKPNVNPENDPGADRFAVTADYLRTMRIPIRRGRGLIEEDESANAAPVVLINETLARRVWPGADPVGKRVKVGAMDGPWRTIVGVVGDVRHHSLGAPPPMQIYLPQGQPYVNEDLTLVIRSAGDTAAPGEAARRAVADLDHNQVVDPAVPMAETIGNSAGRQRFATTILGTFAAMALLLAAIGIYGVVARAVGNRRREFGIRLALGATPAGLLRLVTGGSLRWIAGGLVIGLAGTLASTRLLAAQLYGVGPRDPRTLIGVSLLLTTVCLATTLGAARKASRVDPISSLRSE